MEAITSLVLTLTIFKMATPHMAKIKVELTSYHQIIKETTTLVLNKVKLETTIKMVVTTYHPTIKETTSLVLNKVKLETTTPIIIGLTQSHQVVRMEAITSLVLILTMYKMATPIMTKIKVAVTTYHPTIRETTNLVPNKVKLIAIIG